ncbi:hypothetical protein F0232_04810 [Vibrio sp. T3Y01]|nr:hypothetical protein [Vibrio sp. T3Y01]
MKGNLRIEMKSFIALTLVIAAFSTSAASQHGKVIGYIPYSVGDKEVIIFKIENNVSKGCNVTGRFAMDSSSLRYKATLSSIMSAYHSKTPIRVNYLETCNSWGNTADANFVCIGDINC